MPTGPAARILDLVLHPLPGVLQPGPGSPNVLIGGLPAWRGVSAKASASEAVGPRMTLERPTGRTKGTRQQMGCSAPPC